MSSLDSSSRSADLAPSGRKRKGAPFLVLAAGLLFFAAAVGAAFILLRPTTLRIAVGPAGSNDLQLIQALAQTFAQDAASVRLSVVATAGGIESIAALGSGRADLAVARTDEDMPAGTESVAILRKNVVVLWAPANPGRKTSRKDTKTKVKALDDLPAHRVGVVGRIELNVTLLRVFLKESGVEPDKVEV